MRDNPSHWLIFFRGSNHQPVEDLWWFFDKTNLGIPCFKLNIMFHPPSSCCCCPCPLCGRSPGLWSSEPIFFAVFRTVVLTRMIWTTNGLRVLGCTYSPHHSNPFCHIQDLLPLAFASIFRTVSPGRGTRNPPVVLKDVEWEAWQRKLGVSVGSKLGLSESMWLNSGPEVSCRKRS